MSPTESSTISEPPIHRLWLTLIALNCAVIVTATFLPVTALLQLGILAWWLFYFGVQIAWTLTLVGDAQQLGAAGVLTRGAVAVFMIATCFLSELWLGFVLGQLLRSAALRLRDIDAELAQKLEQSAAEAGKLLFAAIVALALELLLVASLPAADPAPGSLWDQLAEGPSLVEQHGMLNAILAAGLRVAYAWFALTTTLRAVPFLVRARRKLAESGS